MIFKNLRDQKGQAVMSVVAGVSVVLITSLSLYTISWQQHLANNVQVKEAYNLMDAMEQAAKDIQTSWDQAVATSPQGATAAVIQGAFVPPTPSPSCSASCPGGGGNLMLCYPNPTNANNPYCFYGGGTTSAKLDLKLVMPQDNKATFFEKTFEKLVLWSRPWSKAHVFEDRALAQSTNGGGPSYEAYPRSDTLGKVPTCPTAGSSCMSCGNGNGAMCVNIYACPTSFTGCKNYNGSQQRALFAQQFYLIPPGAINK
jgi:hypothetical protein